MRIEDPDILPKDHRGYSGFQETGVIEWGGGGSVRLPTKPKNSLGQKLTPKKSHAEFPNLKIFQKALIKWYNMRQSQYFSISFNIHPKKYLPNFRIQKNPGIENFKRKKKTFDHLLHLKSGVPPPTHPPPPRTKITLAVRSRCSRLFSKSIFFKKLQRLYIFLKFAKYLKVRFFLLIKYPRYGARTKLSRSLN